MTLLSLLCNKIFHLESFQNNARKFMLFYLLLKQGIIYDYRSKLLYYYSK